MNVYVEGGGDTSSLRAECRRGFAEFLKKAGLAGSMPRIIACGSRRDAYNSFCTAISQGTPAMLLVDSEEPVTAAAQQRSRMPTQTSGNLGYISDSGRAMAGKNRLVRMTNNVI